MEGRGTDLEPGMLKSLSRKSLQAAAKSFGIKANQKSDAIVAALMVILEAAHPSPLDVSQQSKTDKPLASVQEATTERHQTPPPQPPQPIDNPTNGQQDAVVEEEKVEPSQVAVDGKKQCTEKDTMVQAGKESRPQGTTQRASPNAAKPKSTGSKTPNIPKPRKKIDWDAIHRKGFQKMKSIDQYAKKPSASDVQAKPIKRASPRLANLHLKNIAQKAAIAEAKAKGSALIAGAKRGIPRHVNVPKGTGAGSKVKQHRQLATVVHGATAAAPPSPANIKAAHVRALAAELDRKLARPQSAIKKKQPIVTQSLKKKTPKALSASVARLSDKTAKTGKKKFDLKASLSKKLKYTPHKGRLKPLDSQALGTKKTPERPTAAKAVEKSKPEVIGPSVPSAKAKSTHCQIPQPVSVLVRNGCAAQGSQEKQNPKAAAAVATDVLKPKNQPLDAKPGKRRAATTAAPAPPSPTLLKTESSEGPRRSSRRRVAV